MNLLLALLAGLPASPALTPVVLDDGHAVHSVVAVQPFALDQAISYAWSAEHPKMDHGLLVVLEVDPSWLRPSDTHQAVLYADGIPVERLNTGFPSGRVAIVIPDRATLGATSLYFGGYELPERVDASFGAEVHRLATAEGIHPLPSPPPSALLRFKDEEALYRYAWSLPGIVRP